MYKNVQNIISTHVEQMPTFYHFHLGFFLRQNTQLNPSGVFCSEGGVCSFFLIHIFDFTLHI